MTQVPSALTQPSQPPELPSRAKASSSNENVKYTVHFEINVPQGVGQDKIGGRMNDVEMMYGQETALPKNMFTVTGYSFLGWSTTEGTAEAGEFFRDKAMVKDLAIGLPTNEVHEE